MKELLKIAKENYPVGTVFKSVRFGKEVTVTSTNFTVDNGGNIYINDTSIYYENEWAEIISNPEVKEETMTLLEEAKKRFPVGTKFVPAHFLEKNDNYYCIIVEDGEFVERKNGSIFQAINGIIWDDGEEDTSRYGNTWWNRMLYHQGNWARVIEEPKTRIVESLNECKAEDPIMWKELRPGIKTRTFGQIKEDDFFERAYTSICKMQQAKNKKYGESALSDKFNLFDGKTKLAPRLKDKLNRVDNSPILIKNDISDLIGYLMLVCKENNWDNFEDLID